MLRNSEEVPEDFFVHVSCSLCLVLNIRMCNQKYLYPIKKFYLQICKSEQNGIELGSVVEVENEDYNGYWFASVCSSKGVIIKYSLIHL